MAIPTPPLSAVSLPVLSTADGGAASTSTLARSVLAENARLHAAVVSAVFMEDHRMPGGWTPRQLDFSGGSLV